MVRLLKLTRAEFVRSVLITLRYPLELITGILIMYLIFLGLFLGARSLIQQAQVIEISLSNFLISYLMWFFVISTMNRFSYSIQVESQEGVLEQIYLNYPRYIILQFIRGFVDFVESLAIIGVLLILITMTTGRHISVDIDKSWQVFLVIVITVIGINGFGLIFGGLALLFKRIGQVGSLTQFAFFLVAYLPVQQFSPITQYLLYSLPLTQGVRLVKLIVMENVTLFQPNSVSLFFALIINSALYLLFGSVVFLLCERKAKLDGRLGQY